MTAKKNLPQLYLITSEDPDEEDLFLNKLKSHLLHGIRLVQLRLKTWPLDKYQDVARKVIALGRKHDAIIILNTYPYTATELDADGVHISSDILMQLTTRPIPKHKYLSTACHNEAQLKQAELIGADFVTLSPVLPTKTHPEASPLGWEAFNKLCHVSNLPVFALGGLSEVDLPTSLQNHGYGIAAINALWNRHYDK